MLELKWFFFFFFKNTCNFGAFKFQNCGTATDTYTHTVYNMFERLYKVCLME